MITSKSGWVRKIKFPYNTILKDWLSRCDQNETNTIAPHFTHLMCSLLLLHTISLQVVARYGKSLPFLLVFALFLQSQSYINHAKELSKIWQE